MSPGASGERTRGVAGLACSAVVAACLAAGCAPGDDARTAEIASVIARADEPLLRTRPALVTGKYALMASDPYAFFRGTVPLYLHDWSANREGSSASRFALSAPLVLSLGDAHLENFGSLRARDGSLALEANDFDGADRTVYLWDVRRLVTAMGLAARLSNPDDPGARAEAEDAIGEIAAAAARGYATAMLALAAGEAPERRAAGGSCAVVEDLFARSEEGQAAREELEELTVVGAQTRSLRRGVIDPDEPEHALLDLPEVALEAIPGVLAGYRGTLIEPPPASFFEVLDAARERGTGVASFPRVRALVLVEGPSADPGDDVVLEIKELPEATVALHPPPDVAYDSVQARILGTSRSAWAMRDAEPLWGAGDWLGLPCQVRAETAGQKTLRVRRLKGDEGTPEALADLGAELGALLARIHATPEWEGGPSPAAAIAGAFAGDVEGFVAEQSDVGVRQAAGVLDDQARFGEALEELGPTLGVTPDRDDPPSPELAALYSGLAAGAP